MIRKIFKIIRGCNHSYVPISWKVEVTGSGYKQKEQHEAEVVKIICGNCGCVKYLETDCVSQQTILR